MDNYELLEKLRQIVYQLAEQQAMPDDSWIPEWEKTFAELQKNIVPQDTKEL